MNGRSAPALAARALAVTYPDGTRALDGLDLTVERGRSLAVLGESGSGKSTFLAAVLGLLPSRAAVTGSLTIDGIETVGSSARELRKLRRGRIGYVPQDPFAAVDPLRPVVHHIRFAARAAGTKIDAATAADRLVALGIDPETVRTRRWPHTWSGGMLQRACIAAATITAPPLVLADEPTSALDLDTGDTVLRDLRSRATTLIIVTHDLHAAAVVADDLAILRNGQLIESGRADDILAAPQHPYTQSLLAAARATGGLDG